VSPSPAVLAAFGAEEVAMFKRLDMDVEALEYAAVLEALAA
jgi:hypothetical protein